MRLNRKLTLHVPHFAFDGDDLVPIDYRTFIQRVMERLNEVGIRGMYSVPATGYYKGRVYGEELLTVFCRNFEAPIVELVFRDKFKDNNDIMKQEAFAYEVDGVMQIVSLTE